MPGVARVNLVDRVPVVPVVAGVPLVGLFAVVHVVAVITVDPLAAEGHCLPHTAIPVPLCGIMLPVPLDGIMLPAALATAHSAHITAAGCITPAATRPALVDRGEKRRVPSACRATVAMIRAATDVIAAVLTFALVGGQGGKVLVGWGLALRDVLGVLAARRGGVG